MKSTDTKKGIDGINSIVNKRATQGHLRNTPANKPIETPVRTQPYAISTPSTGMSIGQYPGSVHRHPIPMSLNRPPTFISATPTPKRIHEGKENESPQERRHPCNCKKSNCLKLYCVCFQQQLFCDGCNCNDCSNIEVKNEIRLKAIKDTIAKNPGAFKPRFSTKIEAGNTSLLNRSPSQGHNVGCKCKRSQCLKKYCECFEASAICSDKCKCIDCQNFVGSQQLIDRRRKIKDIKGAEMAMRSSHDVWKNGVNSGMRKNIMHTHGTYHPSPVPHTLGQHPLGLYPMPMISPPPGTMHASLHQHFMGRPQIMMGPLGFTPVAMQPITPFSASGIPRSIGRERKMPPPPSSVKKPTITNKSTSKSHAARKGFDPHSINQKEKNEAASHYFGSGNAAQTKTTALTVFSFLSNDDIYNASLVCHAWSKLSLDEELWQFEEAP